MLTLVELDANRFRGHFEGSQGIPVMQLHDEREKRIIECPVCQSRGADIHHDIRSSLRYFCQHCQHEWQIDPEDEPLALDPDISPGPMKGSC
jgi:DNA-directed RNA polymerase subunit RPC12/RpoP